MSFRVSTFVSLVVAAPFVAPVGARADGLVIPGIGPGYVLHERSGYRAAVFPPPQHDGLGRPVPPPLPYDRPTYRQTYNDFPPVGGRYGGGFLEYVLTGGRPEPTPETQVAPAYGPPAVVVTPAYNPIAATLPHSALPDYAPQPPAYYGNRPQADPVSYNAVARPAYNGPGQIYDPVAADPGIVNRPIDPMFYRQDVAYAGRERPGTIIIDTPEKFLYLIQPGGHALRYGIGVGRPGFAWAGIKTISRKAEWPDWTPPSEMLQRRPDLPRHMAGGIANPLGARALYLGPSLYRIHGTNEPYTIGTNVSSGCIRMMNHDVEDLYGRVGIGTRVVVL